MKTMIGRKMCFTLLLLATGLHLAAYELICPPNMTGDVCYQINTTTHTATLSGGYPPANFVIPETVENNAVNYTVTAIGEDAFKDKSGITSLTIPATVETIGNNAFAASTITSNIVSVTFAATCNTTLLIDSEAFHNCNMDTVILPVNTKQINWRAFNQCHAIKKLVIPNTVDSIESLAFRYCDGLKDVYVSWPGSQVSGLKIKKDIFEDVPCASIPLHIPKGTKDVYKEIEPWKYFKLMSDTAVVTDSPTANDRTYDGTMQDLVIAGTVSGGTMHYSMDNSTWSPVIPQGKDYGTYTVYFKAAGDTNHEDSIPASNSVPVTISKKDLNIKADDQTISYGDPLIPSATYTGFVTGEDAGVLSSAVEFDCDYHVGSPVGTYPIVLKNAAAANYEISYTNGTITVEPDVFVIHAHPDPDSPTEYYSTFYHSSKNYAMPDGVNAEAYVAALNNGALYLTKVAEGTDILPADHAVILKANANTFELSRSLDDPVSIAEANSLLGTDVAMAAPDHCYVLSDHSSDHTVTGLGFYHYTIPLNSHKAYVLISGSSQAPQRLRFIYETPTGIESITNNSSSITNKIIIDGHLIIIREGVQYNAYGQKIQ